MTKPNLFALRRRFLLLALELAHAYDTGARPAVAASLATSLEQAGIEWARAVKQAGVDVAKDASLV